jgi:hypothetical protein
MRITIDVLPDCLLRVTVGSEKHTVTEAHIRFDGPIPVLDLSHPLQQVEAIELPAKPKTYLDGTPT